MKDIQITKGDTKTVASPDPPFEMFTRTHLMEAAMGVAVVGVALLSRGRLASVEEKIIAEKLVPRLSVVVGEEIAKDIEPVLNLANVSKSAVERDNNFFGFAALDGGLDESFLSEYANRVGAKVTIAEMPGPSSTLSELSRTALSTSMHNFDSVSQELLVGFDKTDLSNYLETIGSKPTPATSNLITFGQPESFAESLGKIMRALKQVP